VQLYFARDCLVRTSKRANGFPRNPRFPTRTRESFDDSTKLSRIVLIESSYRLPIITWIQCGFASHLHLYPSAISSISIYVSFARVFQRDERFLRFLPFSFLSLQKPSSNNPPYRARVSGRHRAVPSSSPLWHAAEEDAAAPERIRRRQVARPQARVFLVRLSAERRWQPIVTSSGNYRAPSGTYNYIFDPG